MAWFMLAMVLFPDTQRKAQEELDAVVGRGRLPTFDDLESLVYIQAIVKEILRWHPVGPLGKYLTSKPYYHVHIIMVLIPLFSLGMQHRSTEVGDQVLVDYVIAQRGTHTTGRHIRRILHSEGDHLHSKHLVGVCCNCSATQSLTAHTGRSTAIRICGVRMPTNSSLSVTSGATGRWLRLPQIRKTRDTSPSASDAGTPEDYSSRGC